MIASPSFPVPQGAVAGVSIIDTTFRAGNITTTNLMKPLLPGFETLPAVPTWSWLIESSDGRRALFDLGVPKDREKSYAPALNARIPDVADVTVEKEVSEILEEQGIDLKDIDSIIWSHWHWDHIGDPSTFPHSTDLVVGPGFKKNFLPAYPTDPDSFVMESHFTGRNLREIDFSENPDLRVGDIPAYDFFGDGSFFLLDIPGHAIGHLGGLARTTRNPDTFIFMGADLCHHGSAVRPSKFLPYPSMGSRLEDIKASSHVCPGSLDFSKLNREVGKSADEPIFGPAVFSNESEAIETVKKAQHADASGAVWFTFAHDATMEKIVELFPRKANEWKKKGWKEKTMWRFLDDLVPAAELVQDDR